MNPLVSDLQETMSRLDSDTAALLERAVRDALALAEHGAAGAKTRDDLGYPIGYFEATAGSFANEPLAPPADLPMETRESW